VANNPYFICRGCGDEVVGIAEAHCDACHTTFVSDYAFDKHVAELDNENPFELPFRNTCRVPETLGFMLVERHSEATGGTRKVWATGEPSQRPLERL
jgi:hypothetical protein